MNEYTALRMETPDRNAVPTVRMEHTGWLKANQVAAQAQACHDGRNLYVRLEAREQEIRCREQGELAMVCLDSCLECFFAPVAGNGRYFNFEFNPKGDHYFGFGLEGTARARILPDPDWFCIRPFTTETGWGVTFRVPLEFVQIYLPEARFEGEAAINFYKCGDKTSVPHYLSWAEMDRDLIDFHIRDRFGRLIFG